MVSFMRLLLAASIGSLLGSIVTVALMFMLSR
jgi:membrane protein YqaA with SNARE-associated domain